MKIFYFNYNENEKNFRNILHNKILCAIVGNKPEIMNIFLNI